RTPSEVASQPNLPLLGGAQITLQYNVEVAPPTPWERRLRWFSTPPNRGPWAWHRQGRRGAKPGKYKPASSLNLGAMGPACWPPTIPGCKQPPRPCYNRGILTRHKLKDRTCRPSPLASRTSSTLSTAFPIRPTRRCC